MMWSAGSEGIMFFQYVSGRCETHFSQGRAKVRKTQAVWVPAGARKPMG